MAFTNFVELTDPATIRALSHPARTSILTRLREHGPSTATELSTTAGVSPSGASYHLRTLARLGFVKEEPSDDGRERRWAVAVTGYGIPKEAQDSPEVLAAARLWSRRWVEEHDAQIHGYLAEEESFPKEWRKAATLYEATLHVTPEQVLDLGYRFLEWVRAHEGQELSSEAPPRSRRVHFSFVAVPSVGETRPPGTATPRASSRTRRRKGVRR